MLLGTHTPKLDDKGRVILPSKFRDDLGAGIVVQILVTAIYTDFIGTTMCGSSCCRRREPETET